MRTHLLAAVFWIAGPAAASEAVEARAVIAPSHGSQRSYLTLSINLGPSLTQRTGIALSPPNSRRMHLAADPAHPVLCLLDQGDGRYFQIPTERCPQDVQSLRRRVWVLEPRVQLFLLLPVVSDAGVLPRPRTLFDASRLVSVVEYPRAPELTSNSPPMAHLELDAQTREQVLSTVRWVRE